MKRLIIISLLFFAAFANASEQMIEIAVEITEINENKREGLGIEWPGTILTTESNIPTIVKSDFFKGEAKFSVTLKALEESGAAKILSKPKLITKSGTSAKFMVGGEFPIVSNATIGKASVEWKRHGIIMEITPTVMKDNIIDIVITTELSKINDGVSIAGYPEILTRQASSHLQIKDGDTMILAGLIETTKAKNIKGIPFLRSIPILGALFGSTEDVERKTNVLIFVTTKLIEKQ
ncbi:MAG: type II and III secretion system protein [Endomicrobium sp.]|nr:type II and III secretion system protein [Endomicrobium sp.]